MYKLERTGKQTYYIRCFTNIGFYVRDNGDVYLIDSGNNNTAAKAALDAIKENGWNLKGIINTHCHADHIGGNKYIQDLTGCKAWAKGLDAGIASFPLLEPALLYGGYPSTEMESRFFYSPPSEVATLDDADFPKELEIIPLPGHYFNMIGLRTPDNVVFIGDAVMGEETIEKYGVSYVFDVPTFLSTLDFVEKLEADMFVPSHSNATSDLSSILEINRRSVWGITEKILETLKTPMIFEDLLKVIFDDYGLHMNLQHHCLVGSSIRSYLSWLKDTGKIAVEAKDNRLLWKII